MKIIHCPVNGPRPAQEFVYGGELRDMHDPGAVSDEEWADYVFVVTPPLSTRVGDVPSNVVKLKETPQDYVSLVSACLVGLCVPSLLHRLKLDPKIAAGPVTLALADIFALVIYFTSAWLVLR